MSDITMCEDSLCPSRSKCSRFTSMPDERQSYADFKRPKDDYICEDFLFINNDISKEPAITRYYKKKRIAHGG